MIMIGSQSFADVAAAVAALRPVAEAAPEDIVALKTLAEAHALGGETEEALALYARATALAGDAHGHARLGELLMRSGRAREAEENFDRAVTLGALSGRWSERIVRDYCELADLYFSEFDLESALRCHGRATEICPTYPDSATAALLKKHIFSTFSAVEGVVPAAADGGPECHAAGVIWGEDYCRFFTDYTLPSLLSAGNLPELAARERLLFSVYATPDAIAAIDAAPAFRQLKSFAEVLFIELPEALLELTRGDWIDKATRYRNTLRIVAAHHDMASRLAKQKGAAVFYVIPDWVVSEGCFARMHDITRAGKDICVFPVLVVNREAMAPILDANRGTPGEGITLSPERLSALAVEHLHPSWEQFRARGGGFHARQFPSWMLWPFDDKGLILHTFYWSTVYVTARGLENYRGKRFWTHDHRLLDAMLPSDADWRRVGLCNDTGELLIVAASEAKTDYAWAQDAEADWTSEAIAAMAQPSFDTLSLARGNHLLFRERVIFNANGHSSDLAESERRADSLVGDVTRQIADVSLLWA